MDKKIAYVSDLTHTRQTVALNTMPFPVGCLVSYAKKFEPLNQAYGFKIFKYPAKLIESLLARLPDIACFSNYCWNFDLGYQFAERIKKKRPETIIIFGGPNYPTDQSEQQKFFLEHPAIDFYTYKESEAAFSELLLKLTENEFNVEAVKRVKPRGCHFLIDGQIVAGEPAERIRNLDEIPSPYLTGLMDEFFDPVLIPIIQTNRGCPFACTFCVEGLTYYNKVNKRSVDTVHQELCYIAQRLPPAVHDLHITDSNFGMYKEDEAIGEAIAKVQEKYGWPLYIHVATGKNQKERVLKVAKTINGALRLAGSVQSLTEKVLENIKRDNISADGLMELAKKANELGANSYSEIITCLPGETKESHFKTIETVVNAGFKWVRIYQLMMLMGVEISDLATRDKFAMKTKFRVLPRCFGDYDFQNQDPILSGEIEEICVATNDISFEEYLESRLFHLTVEIFYSDSISAELVEFLKLNGISVYRWLKFIHDHRDAFPEEIKKLYQQFYQETKNELWDSKEALEKFVRNREVIQKYVSGEYGSNLIFKYKALAMTKHFTDINSVGFEAAKSLLAEVKPEALEHYAKYLANLQRYTDCRKTDIFNVRLSFTERFDYDFKELDRRGFFLMPDEAYRPEGVLLHFACTSWQMKIVDDGFRQYGTTTVGISRMLSKVFVAKLYREVNYVQLTESTSETAPKPS